MTLRDRYASLQDLDTNLPIFPLERSLLLPRAELPLNIYEPRYLDMVNDALTTSRLIGIIQPAADGSHDATGAPNLSAVGCAGRITGFLETADDRIILTLTGICRFRLAAEKPSTRRYRMVEADFTPYLADLSRDAAETVVDRAALLQSFQDYLDANNLSADWEQVREASNEVLVNTLSMLAPYPATEKQALLEAQDLKGRADTLIAITEMSLARKGSGTRHRLQ